MSGKIISLSLHSVRFGAMSPPIVINYMRKEHKYEECMLICGFLFAPQ